MTIKFPNTLSFKLTLWYASAFLICLVATFMTLYLSLQTLLNSRMDIDLREDIEEFRELFIEEGMNEVTQEIDREMNSSDESEVFLRLYNDKHAILFSSDMSDWEGLDIPSPHLPIVRSPSAPFLETVTLSNQEHPARVISGLIGPGLTLQIGETLGSTQEVMQVLIVIFGGMLVLGIPIASAVGWLIARKAVSGIEEVSRAAKAIEQGDLNRRVSVSARGDEIQTLADTFNAMASRIKNVMDEMREMTDNIAHDLRSPLARIRVMSEEVLTNKDSKKNSAQVASDVLKECDRLIHLINTTLDMAEFDAGVTHISHERVNLSQLVTDLVELFEPVAEAKHITLHHVLDQHCEITGDKHNLQRMAANLLDNALKYTPEEGEVHIELKRASHEFRLTIADTGIGIPASDHQRIFDRFFRCDHSRSQDGCGLGLSFARSVVRAHGGEITLKSAPAKGSIFTSTFPTSSISK